MRLFLEVQAKKRCSVPACEARKNEEEKEEVKTGGAGVWEEDEEVTCRSAGEGLFFLLLLFTITRLQNIQVEKFLKWQTFKPTVSIFINYAPPRT